MNPASRRGTNGAGRPGSLKIFWNQYLVLLNFILKSNYIYIINLRITYWYNFTYYKKIWSLKFKRHNKVIGLGLARNTWVKDQRIRLGRPGQSWQAVATPPPAPCRSGERLLYRHLNTLLLSHSRHTFLGHYNSCFPITDYPCNH